VTQLSVPLKELLQVRNYAARKGTREKARKKKVKVEVKKVGYIPFKLRQKK
jgi:large subunit ribosomal protein L1